MLPARQRMAEPVNWSLSRGKVSSARNLFQRCSARTLPSGSDVGKVHLESLEDLVADDQIQARTDGRRDQRYPARRVSGNIVNRTLAITGPSGLKNP